MKERAYTSFAIIGSYSAIMLFTISLLAATSLISLHQGSGAICAYEVPNGSVVDSSAGTVTFPNGSTVATTELHCQMTSVVWQSVGIAAIGPYLTFALLAGAATVFVVLVARRKLISDVRDNAPALSRLMRSLVHGKESIASTGQNQKKTSISRRTIAIALIAFFVIAYAVPVISFSVCPQDSWGCGIGAHGLVHVSLTRYFFHFGAESSSTGYSLT
jgi:hypothetical protein